MKPKKFEVPLTINLQDDYFVFTGTIWGEIRGGTEAAQENVAQVILNRKAHQPHLSIYEICLAPLQFSCWNMDDPNRAKILDPSYHQATYWEKCAAVAWNALHGRNPNRIEGACNYYSMSDKNPPQWAHPPSIITHVDGFHRFVLVKEK
ncbi:MAG: cell wall hydrolase [Methanobrevibacter sp.]|nr:cell wall hydrolase [Methanobrevibacter sp.]